MSKQQSPFSVRLDPNKIEIAKEQGMDIADVFRKALDREILRRSTNCPTCGKAAKKK